MTTRAIALVTLLPIVLLVAIACFRWRSTSHERAAEPPSQSDPRDQREPGRVTNHLTEPAAPSARAEVVAAPRRG